jgi:hypothetical protein
VSRDTTMDFSPFFLLDCLPDFRQGSPSTAPTCGDGGNGAPENPPGPTPRNLRIIQAR